MIPVQVLRPATERPASAAGGGEAGCAPSPSRVFEAGQPPHPWLSILLPVYGVERYLMACASSVFSQDLEGVEVVLLNDASPDRSNALMRALRDAHPAHVRLLQHARNRGLAAARNSLLEAARGDYIWFVDPDDVVEPHALSGLRRIVKRGGPDLVLCDFHTFDDATGGPIDPADRHVSSFRGPSGVFSSDRDALLAGLFQAGQMHTWTKIVRRAAWPAGLRFPEGRAFEDLKVMPRLALHVKSFFHVAEVWVGYRQRRDSILGTLTLRKVDDYMGALEGFAKELREVDVSLSDRAQAAIAHFCSACWMRAEELASGIGTSGSGDHGCRYREVWQTACPWPAGRLERAYWLRGRFKRAIRWRRWRSRAGV